MSIRTTSFILLLFFTLCTSAFAQKQKTVLVINSYHKEYQWVQNYTRGLTNELGTSIKLIFFDMDTKRLPPNTFPTQAKRAFQKYLQTKPDLVVLADDNALSLLGDRIVARGTPVVFLGINNNPRTYMHRIHEATGVLERPLYKRGLVYLSEIQGNNFDRVLFLQDFSTTSNAIIKQVFKGRMVQDFSRVKTNMYTTNAWDVWKDAVLTAKDKGYDAILVGVFHTIKDEHGNNIPADEVIRWTTRNTKVPIYGAWEFAVSKDMAIGGYVLTGESQGEEAAAMIHQIFEGTPPSAIPPRIGKSGKLVFSRTGLKRWGLTIPHYLKPHVKYVD